MGSKTGQTLCKLVEKYIYIKKKTIRFVIFSDIIAADCNQSLQPGSDPEHCHPALMEDPLKITTIRTAIILYYHPPERAAAHCDQLSLTVTLLTV